MFFWLVFIFHSHFSFGCILEISKNILISSIFKSNISKIPKRFIYFQRKDLILFYVVLLKSSFIFLKEKSNSLKIPKENIVLFLFFVNVFSKPL